MCGNIPRINCWQRYIWLLVCATSPVILKCFFFCGALTFAFFVANVEDSEEGKHELLCYRVGVSKGFPELGYTNVKKKHFYEDHAKWQEDIRKFHGKVYKLWRMLDYKAHVSCVVTANIMVSFVNCSLFRKREPADLKLLAPYF